MAPENEELTPEEKLLKVIQEDDSKQEPQAEAAPPEEQDESVTLATVADTSEPPTATAAVPPPEESKPKSKSKSKSKSKPKTEESAGIGLIGGDGPVVASQKRHGSDPFTVRTASRWVAAAAILFLCLIGWQGWALWQQASASVPDLPAYEPAGPDETNPDPGDATATEPLYVLDEVKQDWKDNNPFGEKIITRTNRLVEITDEWVKYVEAHLNLIGISKDPADGKREAVIIDNSETGGKMLFMKVENTMLIEEAEVSLVMIANDHVILGVGDLQIQLK